MPNNNNKQPDWLVNKLLQFGNFLRDTHSEALKQRAFKLSVLGFLFSVPALIIGAIALTASTPFTAPIILGVLSIASFVASGTSYYEAEGETDKGLFSKLSRGFSYGISALNPFKSSETNREEDLFKNSPSNEIDIKLQNIKNIHDATDSLTFNDDNLKLKVQHTTQIKKSSSIIPPEIEMKDLSKKGSIAKKIILQQPQNKSFVESIEIEKQDSDNKEISKN